VGREHLACFDNTIEFCLQVKDRIVDNQHEHLAPVETISVEVVLLHRSRLPLLLAAKLDSTTVEANFVKRAKFKVESDSKVWECSRFEQVGYLNLHFFVGDPFMLLSHQVVE